MAKPILYSMTGFGRGELNGGGWHVLVELKSLNGKQMELNLKLPPLLKSYEFEVRNLIVQRLQRGSVDCVITLKQNGSTKPVVLNTDLIRSYYQTLQELSDELKMDTTHVLGALLKLPEVVLPVTESIDEEGWQLLKRTLELAIEELMAHRAGEGEVLRTDLQDRVNNIAELAGRIAALAAQRPARMREMLQRKIEENLGRENYDRNRLEQEIIYYIEKFDISEELVRLKNHCNYFLSILQFEEMSKGKKLGFLLQEIGREINTTGAKAYDAEMQKLVVIMKDELEKAKEQVQNVM